MTSNSQITDQPPMGQPQSGQISPEQVTHQALPSGQPVAVSTDEVAPVVPTFAEIGLHPSILQAVADTGYTVPTPIQAQALPSVMAGNDVMVGNRIELYSVQVIGPCQLTVPQM